MPGVADSSLVRDAPLLFNELEESNCQRGGFGPHTPNGSPLAPIRVNGDTLRSCYSTPNVLPFAREPLLLSRSVLVSTRIILYPRTPYTSPFSFVVPPCSPNLRELINLRRLSMSRGACELNPDEIHSW